MAKIESKKCKECGFRIRGANHEKGLHHNGHKELTAKKRPAKKN